MSSVASQHISGVPHCGWALRGAVSVSLWLIVSRVFAAPIGTNETRLAASMLILSLDPSCRFGDVS